MTEATPSRASRPVAIDGLNCASMNRDQMIRTREGGFGAINYTCIPPLAGLEESLKRLAAIRKTILDMPDVATIVSTSADVKDAYANNKVGVILGTQNSLMVESDVALLGAFRDLGLRIMQPTYNEENAFGFGASFEGHADKGMKPAGRDWLAEMERLGIVADLSHCGLKTTSDYLAAAKRPIVISHANAIELCANPRNKTNAQISAVAKTGGLIGATMWSPLVRIDRRPEMDDFLNHIDHLVKYAGVEHVAFASDLVEPHPDPVKWAKAVGREGEYANITGIMGDWYHYENRLNTAFASMRDAPGIWDAMKKRGYSEADVEKMMGGNWLRVMKDIWGA